MSRPLINDYSAVNKLSNLTVINRYITVKQPITDYQR